MEVIIPVGKVHEQSAFCYYLTSRQKFGRLKQPKSLHVFDAIPILHDNKIYTLASIDNTGWGRSDYMKNHHIYYYDLEQKEWVEFLDKVLGSFFESICSHVVIDENSLLFAE